VRRLRRFALLPPLFAIILVASPAQSGAASQVLSHPTPVKVARVGSLGRILVTSKGFALYHWTKEKGGKIKCTDQCAQSWPPLLLPKGAVAPRTISGVAGRLGVVIRPDGTHQLTYNGMALYTYVDDTKPGEALCQAIEGWYVLKASSH
jgi:predicted lipoprotein with Yx(FWY)xxD motif